MDQIICLEKFLFGIPIDREVVLCRTQIFRVLSEYERRFSSIYEHEHHQALDIQTSSGTNIKSTFRIVTKKHNMVAITYVTFLENNILHKNVRQVFPSI